jgi:hypothetical protein
MLPGPRVECRDKAARIRADMDSAAAVSLRPESLRTGKRDAARAVTQLTAYAGLEGQLRDERGCDWGAGAGGRC